VLATAYRLIAGGVLRPELVRGSMSAGLASQTWIALCKSAYSTSAKSNTALERLSDSLSLDIRAGTPTHEGATLCRPPKVLSALGKARMIAAWRQLPSSYGRSQADQFSRRPSCVGNVSCNARWARRVWVQTIGNHRIEHILPIANRN
jgi:hypothetical protein